MKAIVIKKAERMVDSFTTYRKFKSQESKGFTTTRKVRV